MLAEPETRSQWMVTSPDVIGPMMTPSARVAYLKFHDTFLTCMGVYDCDPGLFARAFAIALIVAAFDEFAETQGAFAYVASTALHFAVSDFEDLWLYGPSSGAMPRA
jgi:hypothetical protein